MNNERRIAWPTILATIAIVTIAVTLGLIAISLIVNISGPLEWWKANVDNPRQLYLLSATAQVLAALFALVFSITLIAVQFVTKYTHRTMPIVFTGKVIIYMGGFALAVVLPLWFISHPTGWGSLVSVIIGSLYVLSLVGFFLYLRDRIKVDATVEYLMNEGLKAITNKLFKKAEDNINTLDNIGMGAYSDFNFEVFELTQQALTNIALEINKKYCEPEWWKKGVAKEREIHNTIFERLHTTCEEVLHNRRAPKIVIKHVGRVGMEALKPRISWTRDSVLKLIQKVERLCVEESLMPLSVYCAETIQKMTDHPDSVAIKYELISTEKGIYYNHLQRGWSTHASNFLRRVASAIRVYSLNEEGLFSHLVEYLDFSIKPGIESSWLAYEVCGAFRDIINNFKLEGEIPDSFRLMFMLTVLNESAEKCLSQKGEWWEKCARLLYVKISWIAYLAFRFKDLGEFNVYSPYAVIKRTIEHFSSAVRSNKLDTLGLKTLLFVTMDLVLKLNQEYPDELNEEWIKDITKTLSGGFRNLIKSKEVHHSRLVWKKFKPFSRELLKTELSKETPWKDAIAFLSDAAQDIAWANHDSERPLPQGELFVTRWLLISACISLDYDKQMPNLARDLAFDNLQTEFLEAYPQAVKEEKELGLGLLKALEQACKQLTRELKDYPKSVTDVTP